MQTLAQTTFVTPPPFSLAPSLALPTSQFLALEKKLLTNPQNFLSSNSITRGAPSEEKRCREAQASSAFLWFAWFVFCLSLGTDIWEWARWGPSGTVRSAGGGVPGRRTQRPMSQV